MGNEWLGWRTMLSVPNDALLEDVERLGKEIRERADVLICVGIGGSYLGAEAVISALAPSFGTDGERARILFAGHHLSGTYLMDLLDHVDGSSVYVNVISKSGTTIEPAVAFRFIRQWMEKRFDDASQRIIVTTDANKGALHDLAVAEGYRSYAIPDDVGGRFSVLTPVGLIPVAAAGLDVRSLFYGAVEMQKTLDAEDMNPAVEYASRRYVLHEQGFAIEQLSVFDPRLAPLGDWWRQLFGESEGKDGKGLYPAVSTFTTDLHSMGQMIQEGRRNVLETFLSVEKAGRRAIIPEVEGDPDGLNHLAGRSVADINRAALDGTFQAHTEGGVPVIRISVPALAERYIGGLIYFLEHAVTLGGYLLGVNPFDQPGVEAYKRHMLEELRKSR